MGSTKDYSKITHHAVFGIKQHWDKAGTPDKGDPSTTTNVGFAWSNTMNGERLANWRRLIRENKDATTDMLAESRSIDHVDGDQYVKARRKSDNRIYHRGDAGWCYPSLAFGTDPFSTLSSDSALRDANSKWYSRATAAQTQLMAGVTVGELGKTLSMVRGRGASMLSLLYAWRTAARRLRREKNWSKKLSDLYLEYAFGWRPLALDIAGGLAAWKDPRKEITRVSVSAKTASDGSTVHSTTTFGTLQYSRDFRSSTEVVVRVRGGVKVETAGHGRNMQAFGLLPKTWIPSIYELVPWSFFVDYFTDLGNVINALCFPQGDISWACTSTTKTFVQMVNCHGARLAPGFDTTFEVMETTDYPQVTTLRRKQYSRVRGAPRIPTPTVRFPSSLRVWANVAALAISGFAASDRGYARSLRI
jgi:hypothetical protein